jgi:predicted PurR-regulated permease PerM
MMILILMLVLFILLGTDKSINAFLNFLPSKCLETLLYVIYEMNALPGKFVHRQIIEAFL